MAMIMDHEGVRNTPYKDSQGLWTIGVGHLIGDGRSLPPQWNRQFSDDEVMALFAKDYLKHKAGAERGPGYDKANQTGRAALIDLAFNMGNNWYSKFPKATTALKAGDFNTASVEMIDSDWYKQVGRRAPKIVSMIRSGTDISMNTIVPQQNETGTQLAQASTFVNAAKQKPTASPTIIVAHNTTQALAASNGPQGRAEFIGAVGA
jgi:lysozyme